MNESDNDGDMALILRPWGIERDDDDQIAEDTNHFRLSEAFLSSQDKDEVDDYNEDEDDVNDVVYHNDDDDDDEW